MYSRLKDLHTQKKKKGRLMDLKVKRWISKG
jgi:hypothetical protein